MKMIMRVEVKFKTGVTLSWDVDIFLVDEQHYSLYKDDGSLVELEVEMVERITVHKVWRVRK